MTYVCPKCSHEYYNSSATCPACYPAASALDELYREVLALVRMLEQMQPEAGSPEHGLLAGLRAACSVYEHDREDDHGQPVP